MSKSLIGRIDETRHYWSRELEVCRNELLDTIRLQNPLARLVVEFDYLLVEAKLALKTGVENQEHEQEDEFCPACDAGAGHCIGHHEDNDEIPF